MHKKDFPMPKTGFLIISDFEKNSGIKRKIEEIFNSNNFKLKVAMSYRRTGNLYCKICEKIIASAFGVALITSNTPKDALPNIYLEMGLMTAFGKEVVILTDDRNNIGGDLQGKEVFPFRSDIELRDLIENWIKEIPDRITLWRSLVDIWIEGKDYEKVYAYLRKAIMYGDFEESLLELEEIFEDCQKGEIVISDRLKNEIGDFLIFVRAFK